VRSGLDPTLQAAAETNCGPWALNVQGGVLWLLMKVGATAPAVP